MPGNGKVWIAWQIATHLGLRWVAYRAIHALKQKSRWYERSMPVASWDAKPLQAFIKDSALADSGNYLNYRKSCPAVFFFQPSDRSLFVRLLNGFDNTEGSVKAAERIKQGELLYFSHQWKHAGFPPDWHRNPFTGSKAPAKEHWSRIPDFGFGDIKVVWEPSRFGFAYALVRAYWRTGDESYPETFWRLFEDWWQNNPPNCGANWKCGQEVAFRVMAVCFALHGFLDSRSTTGERVRMVGQFMAVCGERIDRHIDYALSQKNNHGFSEALGLWTIGVLFPEFASADRWRERGRRLLEQLCEELICPDGSFSQHSMNYHRVMLHDLLWCFRLAELNGLPFGGKAISRFSQAANFLYQCHDQESGKVPCYGANDGALVLPLNGCDYQDFRPAVQAAGFFSKKARLLEPGPWDEDILWLFGLTALEAPVVPERPEDFAAGQGGYYTQHHGKNWFFVRCGGFRHRPSHADLLHLDLWVDGANILVDPGTYSYNAPEPWNNPLGHTCYHNTVTVDDLSQMDQIGKFLWMPWAKGIVRADIRNPEGISYWEGEHDGYARLAAPVRHRRSITTLPNGALVVVDSLESKGSHLYRLHWLMGDFLYEWRRDQGIITLKASFGRYCMAYGTNGSAASASLVRADPASPRGWRSTYYQDREPALSFALEASGSRIIFWTVLARKACQVQFASDILTATAGEWRAILQLENCEQKCTNPLVRQISYLDSEKGRLELSPVIIRS